MMHQVRGASGGINAAPDTSWEFIKRYSSGQIRTHVFLDSYGSHKQGFNKDGILISDEATQLSGENADERTTKGHFTYDTQGRVLAIEFRSPSNVRKGLNTFKYDDQGRLIEKYSLFGLNRPFQVFSNQLLSYDSTGTTEVETQGYTRSEGTVLVTTTVAKRNSMNRLTSFDFTGTSEYQGSPKRYHKEFEFNNSTTTSSYFKEETYVDLSDNSSITIKLYDKENRLLSISHQEPDGTLVLLEKHIYHDLPDKNSNIIYSEAMTYAVDHGVENLIEKIVSNFEYGPHGIEFEGKIISDGKGQWKGGSQSMYIYCD
jgi:hypothetical protein